MKKIFLMLSVLLFSSLLFAVSPTEVRNIKAVEIYPNADALSSSEASWLPTAVGEKLEANLSKYTDFSIVNSSNKKEIIRIQKESESGAFLDDGTIKIGSLTTASHGIFLVIRSVGGKYTASLTMTNLTSGKNLTTIVSKNPVETLEELYISSGCTIDLLTIDLCHELGLPLTPTKENILRHGELSLSDDERSKQAEDEIRNLSRKMDMLDEEIRLLDSDTDLNAEVIQKQLKLDKALTEEKLRKAREDQKRIEEEARRKAKDEIRDMERTQEQRNKINEMSSTLNKKLSELRNQQYDSVSLLGQIKIIESIKKAYSEMKEEEDNAIFNFTLNAQKDIQNKKNEIENAPLKFAEQNSEGEITAQARDNRKNRVRDYQKKRNKELEDEIDDFLKGFKHEKEELLLEIHKGYDRLSSQTITTLNDELIVSFGNYDGEECGWDIFITVQSDDIILFETTSFISYEQITGKRPATNYNDEGYDDYNDEVDFLVSMFSTGEPYLTFSLDYYVTPLSEDQPSKYLFKFANFYFYKTSDIRVRNNKITSKPIDTLYLREDSIERQMYPAYDIRDKNEIREEKAYKEEVRQREEHKRAEQERKEIAKEERHQKYQSIDFGRTQASFNYELVFDNQIGDGTILKGDFCLGFLDIFYLNAKFSSLTLKTDNIGYFNGNNGPAKVFLNTYGLGFDIDLSWIDFYGDLGIGYASYTPINYVYNNGDGTVNKKITEFCVNCGFGVSLIFFNHVALNCGIEVTAIPKETVKKHHLSYQDDYRIPTFYIGGGLRL